MRGLSTWLTLATLLALPRPSEACAPAPPEGMRVHIASESAIIVWDEAARREHFIRRASFRAAGPAPDFGFLVPTPSKPELGEVPDEAFYRLEDATRPVIEHRQVLAGVEPTALCLMTLGAKRETASAVASAPVRVLEEKRVAGYDAVVLEADDPKALADWLKDHGYAASPVLTAWLTPYVASKWKLTAFKIAAGAAVGTSAVRMTFSTERPFYPYREPTDQRENLPADAPAERLLRVFFIGPSRVEGTIGSAAGLPGSAKRPWPGKATWSDHLDSAKLPGPLPFSVPPGAFLTAFEDKSSPRPGTDDLFFSPAADQRPLRPPPIVFNHENKVPLPLDVLGGGALVMALWLRHRRKKSDSPAA